MMTLGKRIAQHRMLMGLSQSELAEKSGLTRQTINNYEKDKREPTLLNAMCIADVFGISLDALAKGKQK
jgi:transcriptional regulator with XRE-family HTH domain